MKLGWIIAFSLSCGSVAFAAPSDFDGDGLSDIVLIDINSQNGALSWKGVSPSTGAVSTLTDYGKVGDHIALAPWAGIKPAFIRVDAVTTAATWRVSDGVGGDQTLALGTSADTFVAGADFDGNGVADAAVVKKVGKSLVWDLVLNPFNGGASSTSVKWGKKKDPAFYLKGAGAQDLLAVLRKGSDDKYTVLTKNVVSGKTSKFKVGKTGNKALRPFPVQGSDGVDRLALVRQSGVSSRVYVFTNKGKKIRTAKIPSTGTIIVGNYSAEPGEEIAFQSGAGFLVYNPFSNVLVSMTTPAGIPIDEININTFKHF